MNTQAQLIEVVLAWGRDVVEVRHLDHTHTRLSVGTRAEDDLFVPLAHTASVDLLVRTEHGWILQPLDGAPAQLVADDVNATYGVGPFTLRVRRVEKARWLTLAPVFDSLWANVATVTMAAMVAVVALATFLPSGIDPDEGPIALHSPRFTTLAMAIKPPEKVVVPEAKTAPESAPASATTAPTATTAKPARPAPMRKTDSEVVAGKLALLFGDGAPGGAIAGGPGNAMAEALDAVNTGSFAIGPLGPKGDPRGVAETRTYDMGRVRVGRLAGGRDKGDLGKREERAVTTVADREPEVHGPIDKEVIRRVVRAHVDQARHCYERNLQSTPGLAGKVSLKWTIAPDGHVSMAQASGELGDVGDCLAKAVRTWRFPTFKNADKGGVVVMYPFVFKAG